jgi:hypothetical protein
MAPDRRCRRRPKKQYAQALNKAFLPPAIPDRKILNFKAGGNSDPIVLSRMPPGFYVAYSHNWQMLSKWEFRRDALRKKLKGRSKEEYF